MLMIHGAMVNDGPYELPTNAAHACMIYRYYKQLRKNSTKRSRQKLPGRSPVGASAILDLIVCETGRQNLFSMR